MAEVGTVLKPSEIVAWFFNFLFNLDSQLEWISEWGISRALYLGALFLGLLFILTHLIPNLGFFAFSWLVATSPIWLPVALWLGCWKAWIWYVQTLYLSGRAPVLLEVRMPREVTRSPRAMEIALTALSISSGEVTFIHRGWRGQVRPYFSLEIASFGGEIHFYIWCWAAYRGTVESMMYAHYPEVELVEVEDYAAAFRYDPAVHTAFATEWRKESSLDGVDPNSYEVNAYPIRTYVDFELDKDPKEEFKVDPLANTLEFLSSIRPYEQVWIQLVLRKCGKKGGVLFMKNEDKLWIKAVKSEVERIRYTASEKPTGVFDEDYAEPDPEKRRTDTAFPRPTERQRQQMIAMERNLGKYPFEVGMRGVYLTTGELRGAGYSGNRWIWRPYGNPHFQSHLRPTGWHNPFDYPWQDIHGFRWALHTRRFLDAYRLRSFFHTPWILPTSILTNEELASLWHPPSRAVTAPGLQRIPSTKAEPPVNLPR